MRPYYEHGGITIYHGDCREVLPIIGQTMTTRLITDPPYGYGHYETDKRIEPAFFAALIETLSTVALFGYPEELVKLCIDIGRAPTEWVTWFPENKQRQAASLLPKTSEAVAIFGQVVDARRVMRPRAPDAWGRMRAEQRGLSAEEARAGDVWTDPAPAMACNAHLRLHPNEKPLSVLSKLVLMLSEAGDTICDPCAGSGTALLAAKQLSRRAIGIEIEERYCEIAARRLAQEVLPLEFAA